jgi:hypothetical protein
VYGRFLCADICFNINLEINWHQHVCYDTQAQQGHHIAGVMLDGIHLLNILQVHVT